MLLNDKENKEKKSDFFKDILIAFMVLFISLGCFFTYNPADSPLDLGSDGMNFATYPLGVASFLTVLGLIYLVISIKNIYLLLTILILLVNCCRQLRIIDLFILRD